MSYRPTDAADQKKAERDMRPKGFIKDVAKRSQALEEEKSQHRSSRPNNQKVAQQLRVLEAALKKNRVREIGE